MKPAREAWPQGCTNSYATTDDGNEIYYDIRPVQGGKIEVGLYTDTQCIKEYKSDDSNDPITVENLLGNFFLNNGGSGDNDDYYDFSYDTLEESMNRWNSAFDKFDICQPCVAYDLQNFDGTKYYDDDGGNAGGDMFDCYDDADYTNVNQVLTYPILLVYRLFRIQVCVACGSTSFSVLSHLIYYSYQSSFPFGNKKQCMKFMAKTTMNTATFRDMVSGFIDIIITSDMIRNEKEHHDNFDRTHIHSHICFSSLTVVAVPRPPYPAPMDSH